MAEGKKLDSVEIFISYAHKDEKLLEKLVTHLAALKKQGIIRVWYDREVSPGDELRQEIDQHLNAAEIILLLVSPDFIASDYCYGLEMQRAMERHHRDEAHVIPIILRPVYWQGTPFDQLAVLPEDARPVTTFDDLDAVLLDVVIGIVRVIREQKSSRSADKSGDSTHTSSIPTQSFSLYVPSRQGNRGIASFLLHGHEHVLHYTRHDKILFQMLELTYNQQQLVMVKVPAFPRLSAIERRHSFQIEGVDCLWTFKMLAVVGIMSVQIEVGGVKVFSF